MMNKMGLKAAIVALFVAAPLMLSTGTAIAANGVNCNGVFSGKTPADPITKVKDKKQAAPGETVTYTVQFHATGVSTADVRDCYRVDDGKDGTLNGLVTGFNDLVIHNNGPKGTLETVTFTMTVPTDPAIYNQLIGHRIFDRAKITKGSKESRSDLVGVLVIAPPVQCESDCTPVEICGNGIDDNNNGQIDEDCPVTPPHEICGNHIDDNNNGQIDENCDNGGTTPPGVNPAPKPKPKPKVKGVQLAHTGPAATQAAILGSMLLIMGMSTRFARRRHAMPVLTTDGNSEDAASTYLARYTAFLKHASRR